jgi:SAM-dependent methyltransferase
VLFRERDRAESFGAVADQYDRARPSYPRELVEALTGPGVERVLDVGCGTGIAGGLFRERGCEVVGVEVDARMGELAREKGLEVEIGRFEDWRPEGRLFDLVIAGQAWHWVDPRVGGERAVEALRPGGVIALFWNFGDWPAHVREALMPIYARLEPGLENYSAPAVDPRDARERATLEGIASQEELGEVQTRRFPWSRRYDTSAWVDEVETHSDHQRLPRERRDRLLEAVGEAIDALGGSFEMPYETLLISAVRRRRRR